MGASGGVKDPLGPWLQLLDTYRITTTDHDEIVLGELRPELGPTHPDVVAAVSEWPGRAYVTPVGGGPAEVALVRAHGAEPRVRWVVHVLLLVLTAFTTTMAGALLSGVDPFETRFFEVGAAWLPVPTTLDFTALLTGIPFAATLLAVLLAHELGHYLMALRRGVRSSPPYFIPFPAYYSVVGTLGAFIQIRAPAVRRSTLFDIGIAGPIASLLVGTVIFAVGLAMSSTGGMVGEPLTPFVIEFAGQPLALGTGLLTQAIGFVFFPGELGATTIVLHPVAFAGWIGLFITCLNLVPLGQLDGGHILYALLGDGQRWGAWGFVLLLVPLGLWWWGWWLWCAVAVGLSRGRLVHPPVLQPAPGIGPVRRVLGVVAVVALAFTFIPLPVLFVN